MNHNGQWWIPHLILTRLGYDPEIGSIFRVDGSDEDLPEMFFELDGPAVSNEVSTAGFVRGWWIHRVFSEGWMPDHIPEA